MNRFRNLAAAFWLALALLVAQHAAVLHGLGHATEELAHQQDSVPQPSSCKSHFTFASLSGGFAATAPSLPLVAARCPQPFVRLALGAPSPLRLAFLSRAPPSLL